MNTDSLKQILTLRYDTTLDTTLPKLGWKDLLDFWPLSIVTPAFLILILMANIFQW